MKKTIAVDIDDVIAANAAGFVDFSNKKYGTHLTVDDYHEHWAEVWKVELEETRRRAVEFHESGCVAFYDIIGGAREALMDLKGRFKLIALTSRRTSISDLTKEWLAKYYPGVFDDIVFCGFFDTFGVSGLALTKGEIAKKLRVDYLIDDQIKHIEASVKLGIKTILFGDYAWNRAGSKEEGVVRAHDWAAVLAYFKAEEVK